MSKFENDFNEDKTINPGIDSDKEPGPMQKTAVIIAYISYACAVVCAIAGSMMESKAEDPIFASLMASIVFFLGVGIVLHVMGKANLPNLKHPK